MQSAGRGAAVELRASAWLPARFRGTSDSVAISDALRLCAGLMYARKPPASECSPGSIHITSASNISLPPVGPMQRRHVLLCATQRQLASRMTLSHAEVYLSSRVL